MAQITDGVHVLGNDLVHWYVIEEGGRYTVVDHGNPGMWDELPVLLGQLGSGMQDVEAVLLTHAHPDHVGDAERTRTEAGAEVHVHPGDLALARGDVRFRPSLRLLKHMVRPKMIEYVYRGFREGVMNPPPIVTLTELADGQIVDVPGRPRVVHVPGHTAGSVAFHVPDRDVVFVGDALATTDRFTGTGGPQLPLDPMQADPDQALASLGRLEDLDARIVLVGHGEPWTNGVREAVQIARAGGRNS